MKKLILSLAIITIMSINSFAFVYIAFGAFGESGLGAISWGGCKNGVGVCIGSQIAPNPFNDNVVFNYEKNTISIKIDKKHKTSDFNGSIVNGVLTLKNNSYIDPTLCNNIKYYMKAGIYKGTETPTHYIYTIQISK